MTINTQNSFFVFDLDDTLYSEEDYLRSGINHVLEIIKNKYKKNISNTLRKEVESEKRFIDYLIEKFGLSASVKQDLLNEYRMHDPDISLDNSILILLNKFSNSSKGIAILTDGRSISQRKKLLALGLAKYPAYISEEYNSSKPNAKRFIQIMEEFQADNYVYVGDNPTKDFIAANKLGWMTVGLTYQDKNIHAYDLKKLGKEYHPDEWIEEIKDLEDLFF